MAVVVTLPYDPVWAALDWAKRYCPSYITNAGSETSNTLNTNGFPVPDIDFYFGNEKDATWFRLRWAQ